MCRSKPGRRAIEAFALPPFIDSSCRREPDLESRSPSISALCRRTKFAPRLYPTDRVVYITTKGRYDDFAYDRVNPDPRFGYATPSWPLVDRLGQSWPLRLAWVLGYTLFYVKFATAPWMYALLPFHFIMGPVHGAIVNWCGHKYGYQNFENGDKSRNTLVFDFLTAGELFQNNHHKFGMSPNFAARWFEIDPTYVAIRVFAALGIIKYKGGQRMRYPADRTVDDAVDSTVEAADAAE